MRIALIYGKRKRVSVLDDENQLREIKKSKHIVDAKNIIKNLDLSPRKI